MLKLKITTPAWICYIVQPMDVKVKLLLAFVLHVETNCVLTIKR